MSDSFLPPVVAEISGNVAPILAAIKDTISGLEELAAAAKEASAQLDAVFGSVSESASVMGAKMAEAGTSTDDALASIAAGAEKMAASVEASAAKAAEALDSVGLAAVKASDKTKLSVDETAAKGTAASDILAKVGKATALVGVGVGVESIKMAADFNSATAILQTAAGETTQGLAKARDGIKSIAVETGTTWQNLTEGMYEAEKAGYSAAKGGLDVLKAAAQGAREEGAPLNTVVDAMTTIMRNYNIPASKSVQVMNAMKTAAGEAKTNFTLFSKALAVVLPSAQSAGVSFQEVSGDIAEMTQHGESAQHAAQLLSGTLRSLNQQNNTTSNTLQQLGLNATQVKQNLGKQGLAGTLDEIVNAIGHRLGRNGLYAVGVFKQSASAAQDANLALQALPPSVQQAAQAFMSGSMTQKQFNTYAKSLGGTLNTQATQWESVWKKSQGFSDQLKAGNPVFTTFNDLLAKATGGQSGFQTALLLTQNKGKDTAHAIDKVNKSFTDSNPNVEGWKQTSQQLTVQLAQLKQMVEVIAINIGEKLIPPISAVVGWFLHNKTAAEVLATAIGVGLSAAFAVFAVQKVRAVINGVKELGGEFIGAARKAGQFAKALSGADLGEDASGAAKAGAAVRGGVGTVVSKAGQLGSSAMDFVGKKTIQAQQGMAGLAEKAGEFASNMRQAVSGSAASAWETIAGKAAQLGGALKTAALGALEMAQNMAVATANTLRSAASWVVEKAALLASAVAEKAAAAAEWLLNLAMDANPIMLIVLAVAAIVAAFVVLYNKCGWVRDMVNGAFHLIGEAVSWVVNFVKAHWPLLLEILTGPIGIAVGLLTRYWGDISGAFSAAWHAVVSAALAAVRWLNGLPGMILHALASLGSLLVSTGENMIMGLIHGIENMAGSVGSTLLNMAKSAVSSFTSFLGINSPSRLFKSFGGYVMAGLVDGLTGSVSQVKTATNKVARDLYQVFGETSQRSLQRWVANESSALRNLASARESIANRLKSATKNLATIQSEWTKEQSTVANKIMQNSSIVDSSLGNGASSGDVLASFQQKVQKAREFAQYLHQAQANGLSSALVTQIADAGVDQGFGTAEALATASQGQIQQMNQMQGQLQGAANNIGGAVADSMYGAGLQSAEGLVKGLQSQQSAIEAQMMKIALAMQTALKRALGIRSPSRVMAELGDYTAMGFAQGVIRSTIQAETAAKALATRTIQAATGHTGQPMPVPVGGHGGAAGGGDTYVVNVQVRGSVIAEKELADTIEQELLRKGMRRSTTYQNYKR